MPMPKGGNTPPEVTCPTCETEDVLDTGHQAQGRDGTMKVCGNGHTWWSVEEGENG